METGIYITANIIYLVWELYLGDCRGSFSLLERWVVATLFVEHHFSSVLWPLAGDVRRKTCSFIALTLDIHIFCLCAEAAGAILYETKKVWGMRSEFNYFIWAGPRCPWLCLCSRKFALQNVGGSESQNRLCAWWCKTIWI